MRRGKRSNDPGKVSQNRNFITVGAVTHVGMHRANNQDAYCVLVGQNAPPGADALLAVADGMGGHQAGEVASNLAIQGLARRLSPSVSGTVTLPGAGYYETLIEKTVHEINSEVHQASRTPGKQGMGTTLTIAILLGPKLLLAHVGDSRGFLYRRHELHQLTQDHSWVAEEVARGAITSEQAREHPKRNILTRALGTEPVIQVDQKTVEVQSGDLLLLCSDGLHSLVTEEEIVKIISQNDPQSACELLVERANHLGGHDNTTVLIARIDRLRSTSRPSDPGVTMDPATTLELRTSSPRSRKLKRVLNLVTWPLRACISVAPRLMRRKAR